jgi:hypothetical protein
MMCAYHPRRDSGLIHRPQCDSVQAYVGTPSGDPLVGGSARGGDGGEVSEEDIPLHDEGTTRIDTFASYGQLLTDDYVRNGSRYGHDSQEGDEADVFRLPDDAAAPLHEHTPAQLHSPLEPSGKGSSHNATAVTPPPVARADRDVSPRLGP